MTLLLKRADLAPLFHEPALIDESLDVIRQALRTSAGNPPEHTSFLAYPLGLATDTRLHINVLASAAGTSLKLFPPAAGPTVATGDSVGLLYDEEGRLVAIMDLHGLGSWRTSAPAAVACAALAPAGARVAAMLGSGREAHVMLRALRAAMSGLGDVRVYSRTPENRRRFADEMTTTSLPVSAVEDPREAVAGADVVCVTASAPAPLFEAQAVRPGAVVASIVAQGVPRDLPARPVIPDQNGPETRPSGWDPWPTGGWTRPADILTLADVLRGAPPRRDPAETLLYTQFGAFAWDGPLTRWAYETAQARGAGTPFDFD